MHLVQFNVRDVDVVQREDQVIAPQVPLALSEEHDLLAAPFALQKGGVTIGIRNEDRASAASIATSHAAP